MWFKASVSDVIGALEGIKCFVKKTWIWNDTLILLMLASNAIQQLWTSHKLWIIDATPRVLHVEWRVWQELTYVEHVHAHNDTMHRQQYDAQHNTIYYISITYVEKTIRFSPNAKQILPLAWTCYAVWRMARLESRRRARQAAIPPRVSASSFRTEDTWMGLPSNVPLRNGNSPNGSILVGEGKETNMGFPY